MTKKVTFNGIEISQSRYDKETVFIFNYLDKIKSLLERGLNKEDGNSQFTVDVNFASTKSPKHSIKANGSTSRKTKKKIAHILKKKVNNDFSHVAGSVKVNFLVEDRK